MDQQQTNNLQISYDRVAEEYVKRIFEELAHRLLDSLDSTSLFPEGKEKLLTSAVSASRPLIALLSHDRQPLKVRLYTIA